MDHAHEAALVSPITQMPPDQSADSRRAAVEQAQPKARLLLIAWGLRPIVAVIIDRSVRACCVAGHLIVILTVLVNIRPG